MIRKTSLFVLFFSLNSFLLLSQNVGIGTNTPDASAALEISANDKGLLIPRVDTANISSPVAGLIVYQLSDSKQYYHNGSKWVKCGIQSSIFDNDYDTGIKVEHAPDEDKVRFYIAGKSGGILDDKNVRIGLEAGKVLTSIQNVLIGNAAGYKMIGTRQNIAIGEGAAYNSQNNSPNLSIGAYAGSFNTLGNFNVYLGNFSGHYGVRGNNNTGVGFAALFHNEGSYNVAIGDSSMGGFYDGNYNVAIGKSALYNNNVDNNIGIGYKTGYANKEGRNNIFIGRQSGQISKRGDNIFIGNYSAYNTDSSRHCVYLGNGTGYFNTKGSFNTFLGSYAGWDAHGNYNSYIGYAAGMRSKTTNYNTGVGYFALADAEGSNYNTGLGYQTLSKNKGAYNVALGAQAGRDNALGNYNVYVGQSSGIRSLGQHNTFIGANSAPFMTTGDNNVAVGSQAMGYTNGGIFNLAIGNLSLSKNNSRYNVAIGHKAGENNASGSNNIYLGNFAGQTHTGSDKLYIENTSSSSPLIYGNFDTDELTYNGNKFQISSTDLASHSYLQFKGSTTKNSVIEYFEGSTYKAGLGWDPVNDNVFLYMAGQGSVMRVKGNNIGINKTNPAYDLELGANSAAKPSSSSWIVTSDARLKENVNDFEDGLNLLQQINPVWFDYTGEANMPQERAVGTLAQELQKVAPYMIKEWEHEKTDGTKENYLGVDYGAMDFILINAIKEQQEMIELLKSEIEELKKK